jgi:murein DD-endopeptidase MepM/ murein hydrolase activator NlpD
MRNLWAARPPASVERVRPRAVRRVAPAVIALLVGAALVPGAVGAQTDEDAARRAAAEIQNARDRANAAADAYFRAESDLDQLEDDLAALEQEAVQLGETVDALRAEVENVALARFVNSGTGGIPLLTGLDEPQDQVQAEVFVDVLTNTGSDALDQYDVARQELADAEDELDRRRAQLEDERAEHARLRDAALAEVERLREVEEQRLRDEAVRLALEAQQAEERARLEEIARQEAEAAARAQPNPGASETTAAPATAATTSADSGADSSGSGSDGSSDDSTATTPSTAAPATAAPSGGASGGTSGGRTGSDGSGSQPSGATTPGGYLDNIVCPISGSAYSDTYGAPRSGGRSHQGVDMLAPHGVPIVAVTNGSVSFSNNSLGGLAAWLRGDNGTSYYYAHMSSFAGSSRRVSAGEVIAYNGSTGNANGVPHLHFEVRPGGGLAINPTPTVRAAGC